MVKNKLIALALVAACAACGQSQTAENAENAAARANNMTSAEPALEAIQPGQAGALPEEGRPVPEGPIDPKSAHGAAQILQSYAALLEQRRFAEARRLWSDRGNASGQSEQAFADAFAKYEEIHAEIGAPGQMEGAAGSAYIDIPLRFYGRLEGGRPFNSTGTATLRRVNDVPGSTEEQRQWRIARMEMQPPL